MYTSDSDVYIHYATAMTPCHMSATWVQNECVMYTFYMPL